jgi:seryl-tRNA synthetase
VGVFLRTLKQLWGEFKALGAVRTQVRDMEKKTEETRKKQTAINNDITKLRSMDGDTVKKGLFGGKQDKKEALAELEKQIEEVRAG